MQERKISNNIKSVQITWTLDGCKWLRNARYIVSFVFFFGVSFMQIPWTHTSAKRIWSSLLCCDNNACSLLNIQSTTKINLDTNQRWGNGEVLKARSNNIFELCIESRCVSIVEKSNNDDGRERYIKRNESVENYKRETC